MPEYLAQLLWPLPPTPAATANYSPRGRPVMGPKFYKSTGRPLSFPPTLCSPTRGLFPNSGMTVPGWETFLLRFCRLYLIDNTLNFGTRVGIY